MMMRSVVVSMLSSAKLVLIQRVGHDANPIAYQILSMSRPLVLFEAAGMAG
jgi:hypothetical protein